MCACVIAAVPTFPSSPLARVFWVLDSHWSVISLVVVVCIDRPCQVRHHLASDIHSVDSFFSSEVKDPVNDYFRVYTLQIL